MSQIHADTLYTPDREVRGAAVLIDEEGRVSSIDAPGHGAGEGDLTPGMIDLQCNGVGGADLASAEADAFDRVARALLSSGTTSYCPTLPSAPADTYPRFLDAAAEARRRPGPRILGVHLEGPFLNPERAGAHLPDHLREPDVGWLEGLIDRHPDLVRIVTLAPELPGCGELISLCVERGITVAVGHSDATAEEAMVAFDAGATMLTHLFNAMRPIHHREPGVAGAALFDPRVRCSLIADGHHVHPSVAAFYARTLGPGRCVLVSDAVADPRPHPLAGGFALLDEAVANLTSWEISFSDAIRMATSAPADALGLSGLGRIEPGSICDAVLWRQGKVAEVWMDGAPV